MRLFLIRTPFQAYLCAKIVEQEGIVDYDVIHVSRNANSKDEHYFRKLNPQRSVFLKHLSEGARASGYIKAVLAFPWWLITTRYSHIYLAGFNTWYFRTIIGWQRQAKICTYDDGSGNYINSGASLSGKSSRRDQLMSAALGGRPLKWFSANIHRHYAVNPSLPNIVERERIVGIMATGHSNCIAGEGQLSIAIGQPFQDYLTADQERSILDHFRERSAIYFRHPREEATPPGMTVIESDLIIEDFVEHKLQSYRTIDLIGAWSTALVTINLPGVHKVYLDADGDPQKRGIMEMVGCEVVGLVGAPEWQRSIR